MVKRFPHTTKGDVVSVGFDVREYQRIYELCLNGHKFPNICLSDDGQQLALLLADGTKCPLSRPY
jgi:hypothetical protein